MKTCFNHGMFLSFRQRLICKKVLQPPVCTIYEVGRDLIFVKTNIFIPKGSRCCEKSVFQERLLPDAYDEIRPFTTTNTPFSSTDAII